MKEDGIGGVPRTYESNEKYKALIAKHEKTTWKT
jgi:hypothetical protein